MGFRSANEVQKKTQWSPSSERDRVDSSRRQRSGRLTAQGCEQRFGMDMYRNGLEVIVQRLVKQHGAGQVQQWADEGMTVDTMGKPRDMRAFRERQKQRPAEVPKDIERRNAKSVQRSRGAHHEASKSGNAQVPDSVRDVISSPGQQLDSSIQQAMEERMGESLDDVRIHTGSRAANACEDINARAFTVGNHVAFNHGEYDPSSTEGQHLLAHELAHVRQQTGGAVSMLPQEGKLEIDPDERLEREAEETAQRVMSGGKLGIYRMHKADVHIQRWRDQPRDNIGRFAEKDTEQYKQKKYSIDHRPPYAPGQVEEVWNRARSEGIDDKVRDPNTEEVLTWDKDRGRGEQWHMGHKKQREYRYLLEYYQQGIISEEEFVKEYQNPDHYQAEAPRENMGGRHEGVGRYWKQKWGDIEGEKHG
ncbi:DUF4157 domain-containing protein [Halogeometricum borinquense]|uniref:DUF4157 domain-containing protein n=1 Tax=Halogeometricum borinquense TaxID=60847 RepID=A0A482TP13_9EURY|nr:DUF4157 domain-containing protein [Halogeometricum borinquense]RYJ14645.1 DUF4157 domain-containing protein [Halogeometricum borinquense]